MTLAQDQSSHVMWELLVVGLEIRGGEQKSWAGKSQEQPEAFPPEVSQERLEGGECQELRGRRVSCLSLNKHTWEVTVHGNKVVFSGMAKRMRRWKEETTQGNLYGKCSFVWEVFICSLALRQQRCSYPVLLKNSCSAALLALVRNIRSCPP